jgi:hypothetical protein
MVRLVSCGATAAAFGALCLGVDAHPLVAPGVPRLEAGDKEATQWARLSCHRVRANEVRLL